MQPVIDFIKGVAKGVAISLLLYSLAYPLLAAAIRNG